jgi:hypothetical protein
MKYPSYDCLTYEYPHVRGFAYINTGCIFNRLKKHAENKRFVGKGESVSCYVFFFTFQTDILTQSRLFTARYSYCM